jgi:hypothetical protein
MRCCNLPLIRDSGCCHRWKLKEATGGTEYRREVEIDRKRERERRRKRLRERERESVERVLRSNESPLGRSGRARRAFR